MADTAGQHVRAAFLLKSTPSSLSFFADAESRVQIFPFPYSERLWAI
jgi:hypothetical protein